MTIRAGTAHHQAVIPYRYGELISQGQEQSSVRAQVRAGQLTLVRHGGYVAGEIAPRPEERHLALLRTTVPVLDEASVLSHGTAGLLWGLPVPGRLLTKVHTTRQGNSGGTVGRWLHSHRAGLSSADLAERDGLVVTSLPRTVVDLCCLSRDNEALMVMDAAARILGGVEEVQKELAGAARRKGIGVARWAVQHASPLAESPGESLSRYWMIISGIDQPELQHEVRDDSGALLARADFAWPARRLLGEFDGRIKYEGDLVAEGMSAADVIMAEKRRENRLRAAGWWIIRWLWSDLQDGHAFVRRLVGALDRNPPR